MAEDHKGRCALYHAIKEKHLNLIPLLLKITELPNYKRISYDGLTILTLSRAYLGSEDTLNIRDDILNKYEELDEAYYVKRHLGGAEFKDGGKTQEKIELLKLQRKLLLSPDKRPSINPIKTLPIASSTKNTPRKSKITDYNYDLKAFGEKVTRRSSVNDLGFLQGSESLRITEKPIPEYQPLEIIDIEPYTMYYYIIYYLHIDIQIPLRLKIYST